MRVERRLATVLIASASLFTAGCQLEKLFPRQVAMGVSRLTVRNAAAVVSLVNADAKCGFASPGVLATPVIDGATGETGSVTWTVNDCVLDLGQQTPILEDCLGNKTSGSGRVVVSATRTIRGLLTGSPTNPVVPEQADAVRVDVRAQLEDFVTRVEGQKPALTVKRGSLSFSAEPHLAVSKTRGVCSVPASNITLHDLTYQDAELFVESEDRSFDVEVPTSSYSAQVGKWGDRENALWGQLTVWDSNFGLPSPGDDDGLDPTYDAAGFVGTYACTEDIQQPVSHACPTFDEVAAVSTSRLGLAILGQVVRYFDEQAPCGFSNESVNRNAALTGQTGERGGTAVFTVTNCKVTFQQPTVLYTDCHGNQIIAKGTVTANATRKVKGILTGDPLQPIVPTTSEPAEVDVRLTLQNFTYTESTLPASLTINSGELSAKLVPKVAYDTETGVCFLKTPAVQFQDVVLKNVKGELETEGAVFPVHLVSTDLDAQNGTRGDRTNYLTGTLTTPDLTFSFPREGEPPVLDPYYDPAHFEASYTCAPNLRIATDADCSMHRTLGEAAARLLIQNAGTLAGMVNDNGSCGFESEWVLIRPTNVVGSPGQMGSMSWAVADCENGSSDLKLLETDCVGGKTYSVGKAVIDASRTVVGERERIILGIVNSIVPVKRDAVTINVSNARLSNFTAYSLAAGADEPVGQLILHSGSLQARVQPILGERKSEPGVFDVPTPVASISNVQATDVKATLKVGPKSFKLTIPDATLDAFNGTYKGVSNWLTGVIRVGNQLVELGDLPLNPDFDQTSFNQSYACTEDLKALVPWK